MAKKKRYATDDLFYDIFQEMKQEGLSTDILDYGCSTSWRSKPILDDKIMFRHILDWGGNEGIYLDIYADVTTEEGTVEDVSIGTFKTLDESDEAMQTMAKLLDNFMYVGYRFVAEHAEELKAGVMPS